MVVWSTSYILYTTEMIGRLCCLEIEIIHSKWPVLIAMNMNGLTHWSGVTHICASEVTIIGSDYGLLSGRRQAIIWTNDVILLIGPLGTNFSEILIEIQTFSLKKMHLKMSSAKWRPFCLGLIVLISMSAPGNLYFPLLPACQNKFTAGRKEYASTSMQVLLYHMPDKYQYIKQWHKKTYIKHVPMYIKTNIYFE